MTDDAILAKLSLLDSLDKKLLGESYDRMYHRDTSIPAIFLLGMHEWGNIGDLAINYSEVTFLEREFAGHEVYPISRSALAANWQRIRHTIQPTDIIAVHGGGNFGDIWPHEEIARQRIIQNFPENVIISMPQSIHFGSEENLAEAAAIYNAHERLIIAVRDDKSYDIARQSFQNATIFRTEDIVTTYEFPYPFLPAKNDILFVQRDDAEKRADSGIDSFRESLTSYPTRLSDTTTPGLEFVNTELAAKVVYRKIDEMHSAKVVVTDRLHGAVFALLAGKPVIAFDNTYGKVSGALKNLQPALGKRIVLADGLTNGDLLRETDRLASLPATDILPADVLRVSHKRFARELHLFAGI